MIGESVLGGEFFVMLWEIDLSLAKAVAAGRCPRCGGPLHRGDYPRKPRGGLQGAAGEGQSRRISLCCGREGCRRRATPPSVRFLGRRVYVGALVVLASAYAWAMTAAAASRMTGVPSRTIGRWVRWWQGPFATTSVGTELAALAPELNRGALPHSWLERIAGGAECRLRRLLIQLGPLTTTLVPDCAGWLRGFG